MSEDFTPRQEQDELPRRTILGIAGASIAITLVSLFVARAMLGGGSKTGANESAGAPQTIGTVEQTLVNASRRGLDLRAEQQKQLQRYGWVDRDAGIATIPIDRAMDLVVRQEDRR